MFISAIVRAVCGHVVVAVLQLQDAAFHSERELARRIEPCNIRPILRAIRAARLPDGLYFVKVLCIYPESSASEMVSARN